MHEGQSAAEMRTKGASGFTAMVRAGRPERNQSRWVGGHLGRLRPLYFLAGLFGAASWLRTKKVYHWVYAPPISVMHPAAMASYKWE